MHRKTLAPQIGRCIKRYNFRSASLFVSVSSGISCLNVLFVVTGPTTNNNCFSATQHGCIALRPPLDGPNTYALGWQVNGRAGCLATFYESCPSVATSFKRGLDSDSCIPRVREVWVSIPYVHSPPIIQVEKSVHTYKSTCCPSLEKEESSASGRQHI